MNHTGKAARLAGKLLLDLTAVLGESGFDVGLSLDVENRRALYEVSIKVPKLGTWCMATTVTFHALATQAEGVYLAVNMVREVRLSLDHWCYVKKKDRP